MKQMGFSQRIQQFSTQELQKKLDDTRKDLFGLRINSATTHIKDSSQYKKLKKQIARILTVMQAKKNELQSMVANNK